MTDANYPTLPGVKSSDETTLAAADHITGRAKTLRDAVLSLLRKTPLSADECAKRLNESILSIRPRFSELRAMGLIKDTGQRAKNASRRNAIVWSAENE